MSTGWLVFLLLAAAVSGRSSGGSGLYPRAGGLTYGQIHALAVDAGFTPEAADVATAVALAESGGFPTAVGDQGTSFGLWQIHAPAHPELDASRLGDPSYNAAGAFKISRGGSDWSLWTTYRTGAYRRFLRGGG